MLRQVPTQVLRSAAARRTVHSSAAVALSASVARPAAPWQNKKQKTKPSKSGGGARVFKHKWNDTIRKNKFGLTNSTEIDLATFSASEAQMGTQVVKYSPQVSRSLAVLGSIKGNQRKELYSVPTTLTRTKLTEKLQETLARGLKSSSAAARVLITGEAGIGKSETLAQTHALALEAGYLVLHVSDISSWVDGTTNFFYKEEQLFTNSEFFKDSGKGYYVQQTALKEFIRKTMLANMQVLQQTAMPKFAEREVKKADPQTLFDLLKQTAKAQDKSEGFDLFIRALTQLDIPVLLTCDNFSELVTYRYSAYRSYANEPVYHDDIYFVNRLLRFVSGDLCFRKGAVVLATSSLSKPSETLKVGTGELEHAKPYTKPEDFDEVLAGKMRAHGGVKSLSVPRMTKEEVRAFVKYLIDIDSLQGYRQSDELSADTLKERFGPLVDHKYLVSGNGNPRELLKSCFLQYEYIPDATPAYGSYIAHQKQ